MERFQWLAAIIAAHPEHKVVGRIRLQKTVKLLQRLGAPTGFGYKLHLYGPYSEDLQAEIGLLVNLGFVKEYPHFSNEFTTYYTLEANDFSLPFIEDDAFTKYKNLIAIMSKEEPVILELAATYDTYKEMGSDDRDAMTRLIQKKGDKCNEGRAGKAIELLKRIGLN
jgi:uncharacterized protein YwgA